MSEPYEGAPEGVTEDVAATDQVAEETQAQGDEPSGDDAAAATDEPAPKPRKSVQERIDELTRAQREAEREAEFWKSKATQAPQPQAPQTAEKGEPSPEDYEHGTLDVRFITDLATYRATQAFEERYAREAQERQRQQRMTSFEATTKAATEKHADYYDVVGRDFGRAAALCTQPMQEAILTSDVGGELAYHLASNPDEARRIAALDPISQVRALGRLEGRLAEPAKPIPKTATDAPAPTPQSRGAGGRFSVAPDTSDFSAFEKQYGR